jgi:beta-fructofuranosidase
MPWFPRNQYLWDFWFAWKGPELHVFYLQAPQLACHFNPDRRHDISSVGHAVLTRWGWKELGPDPAFAKADGEAWDNRSIWTGSIIQNPHTGLYYLFYTARRDEDAPVWTPHEWQRPQQIGVAVSPDLITWQRTEASRVGPVIPNPGLEKGLDGVSWRDPYVVQGEDGWFYAFICARLPVGKEGSALDAGGVVAYVKSKDLEHWESDPHLLVQSDEFYQMEVPQVFWRRTGDEKRLYLLFCAQVNDCSRQRHERLPDECQTGTYYMVSRPVPVDSQSFPELEPPARLLAPGWYAGKLVNPETEASPMFYGFQWADEAGHFVGGLSDPMPTGFNPDGTVRIADCGLRIAD